MAPRVSPRSQALSLPCLWSPISPYSQGELHTGILSSCGCPKMPKNRVKVTLTLPCPSDLGLLPGGSHHAQFPSRARLGNSKLLGIDTHSPTPRILYTFVHKWQCTPSDQGSVLTFPAYFTLAISPCQCVNELCFQSSCCKP